MKQFFFIIALLSTFASIGQEDRFKFNFDVAFGAVSYNFNEIKNSGYSFSNMQWNDTVHSTNYEHVYSNYLGLNAVLHAGLHIPIVKRNMFSVGIRPKIGIGRLFQVSPSANNAYDDYGYAIEDSKRISSATMDATFNIYLRYNLFEQLISRSHITALAGYRFIRSNDNYRTPVASIEYGKEHWSLGVYAHLYKMEYYRQYSTGAMEVAKNHYEWGITLNVLLDKKATPTKQSDSH